MKRQSILIGSLITAVGMAVGCGQLAGVVKALGPSATILREPAPETASQRGASLTVKPRFTEAFRRTQTTVANYTRADVFHLVVKPYSVSDGMEMPVIGSNGLPVEADLASADLGSTVVFSNLAPDAQYRIKCFAYKASGRDEADLISITAESSVDVTVESDDQSFIELHVKLKDVAFGGSATSSGISVIDGGYAYSGSPGIATESPTPAPDPSESPNP
ncbi:MAG: hypothetical protein FJZ01_08865 [Candidatus Sericytochromatia bacterium]|nr:hypothetical protein [Candidatus Tanganyikabacteria bacterium]